MLLSELLIGHTSGRTGDALIVPFLQRLLKLPAEAEIQSQLLVIFQSS